MASLSPSSSMYRRQETSRLSGSLSARCGSARKPATAAGLQGVNYYSWPDEGCRLRQQQQRRPVLRPYGGGATATVAGTLLPSVGGRRNTFYEELVRRQQLQQQQRQATELERERRLATGLDTINENGDGDGGERPLSTSRYGGKGAPWRHLSVTTGARGENVMFINGEVKLKDMSRLYPSLSTANTPRRSVEYWTPRRGSGVQAPSLHHPFVDPSPGAAGSGDLAAIKEWQTGGASTSLCARCKCQLREASSAVATTAPIVAAY